MHRATTFVQNLSLRWPPKTSLDSSVSVPQQRIAGIFVRKQSGSPCTASTPFCGVLTFSTGSKSSLLGYESQAQLLDGRETRCRLPTQACSKMHSGSRSFNNSKCFCSSVFWICVLRDSWEQVTQLSQAVVPHNVFCVLNYHQGTSSIQRYHISTYL